MTKKYGYVRVSTAQQKTDIQYEELRHYGVCQIFVDKTSGATTENREALQNLLEIAQRGDEVVVTKIDRLARSIIDLNQIVTTLNSKGVQVRFLQDNLIFEAHEKPSPLSLLMFNILGAFAQFERDLIIERTGAGIEKARLNGIKLGRPREHYDRIERALELYLNRPQNQLSIQEILQLTQVKKSKFYYYLKQLKKGNLNL